LNIRTSRSCRSLYVAAALASLAILALFVAILWKEWRTAYTNAEVSVLNTARLLADQVDHEFHEVDAWLQGIGQRHLLARSLGEEDIRRFHEQLRQAVTLHPFANYLAISDDQGRVIFSTGTDQPLDLRDRDYFRRARDGEAGLLFSAPLPSPVTGEGALLLARSLEDDKGHFSGLVLAILPIEGLGKSFDEVDLGPRGVIDLRAADLTQIKRWPALSGPDQALGNNQVPHALSDLLQESPDRRSYTYVATSLIDGIERFYAYQRFNYHPFILIVGRATADFGSDWRQTSFLVATLCLMVVVVLFGGVRRMERQNQSLELRIAERTRDLAERERFLHTLTDALPSLIGYWDTGLRNRFANRASLEWFGKTPADMLGMRLQDLLGADRFARNEPRVRAALCGERQSFKGRLTKSDGSRRRTWTHFVPDLRGEEVRGFFVLITDITELKQAEAENALLRRILDESPDFIGMADMEGHTLYLNAAAKALIGFSSDDNLGQGHISYLHPPWAARRIAKTWIPIALERGAWIGESAVLSRDGREIPVSQILLVHRDERGRPERLSTIIRDISEQKRQAGALAEARLAAEVASRAKSEFLANMSHEIRTPLNAVLGMAYLLEQSPLEVEQRDKLGKIQTAGRALLELVNDVLDLSKIEAGEMEMERIAFSPAALFDELRALVGQQAASKGLALDFAPLPEALPGALVGDPHRLRQILLNLLNNAVKFTGQGGVRLGAHLLAAPAQSESPSSQPPSEERGIELVQEFSLNPSPGGQGEAALTGDDRPPPPTRQAGPKGGPLVLAREEAVRLRFEVADTGVGIPAEALPSLFTPFTQADGSTTRRFGGTGLGLSIVRHFAELMGGEVGVESREGQGSTFWVELPFAVAPAPALDATPVRATTAPAPPDAEQLPGVRLLLVDDNETNLEVARWILAREGALVSICLNGAAALDWLKTPGNQADIVLMDVQMPVMDGNEAVREIRRDPALAALPVVALTAGALLSERDKSLAAGMNDYLTKPFDPRQMTRVVRRQVERVRGAPLPMGPGRGARSGRAGWPNIAGIDAGEVRARLDGNLALFTTSLSRFLADFGDWRLSLPLPREAGEAEAGKGQECGDAVRSCLVPAAQEAREALARHLHKLAGGAGLLGAKTIHRLAKEAEMRLQAGPLELEGLDTLLAELAAHLASLAAAAAPHLATAARAQVESEATAAAGTSAPPDGGATPDAVANPEAAVLVDAAALAELKAQLSGARMAALGRYQQLAPALRRMLPPEDFSRLDAAMERLDFKTALAVLGTEALKKL